MHSNLSRRAAAPRIHIYVCAAAMLTLTACGGRSGPPPVRVETPPPPAEEAVAHPLGEVVTTADDDPRALVAQAAKVPAADAAALLLRAIAGYIRQGRIDDAEALVVRLRYAPMGAAQRQSLRLQRARLLQARGQHAQALQLLREFARSRFLTAEARARLHLLRADSLLATGRVGGAVEALVRRDRWLASSPARFDNQRRIIQLINSLDALGKLLLREESAADTLNAVAGWVALANVLQTEPAARQHAIRRWRAFHRYHPAEPRLFNQALFAGARAYRHIAVLLPLTAKFGKAAQAFYEGFVNARAGDAADAQPTVSVFDIGEDPNLVSLYYRAAIDDGADFIVGPLGRRAVDALLAEPPPRLPVLIIGGVPTAKTSRNLYGISLSPEQEAVQAALRARADGHRQAGILASGTAWGRRVATAFAAQWVASGGTLVDNKTFPLDISDYSRVIQKYFKMDKSVQRERLLSAQLDTEFEFTPRRRDDMDFLFLAANAEQARLLTPQLRFFQAHDLALYATSYIYDGKPEPALDADLNGIIFGDMNWILDATVVEADGGVDDADGDADGDSGGALAGVIATAAADQTTPPPSPPTPPRPYLHTDLDRLYALGVASYRVLPALALLRDDPRRRYFGKAVDLGVQSDGNVWRYLTWARFERGLPTPLPTATEVGMPLPAPTTPVFPPRP